MTGRRRLTHVTPAGAARMVDVSRKPLTVREAVARALPNCDVALAEHALAGVWRTGQETFDGVCLSLSHGQKTFRAIRSLREIRPNARIVVACDAADEPAAEPDRGGEGSGPDVLRGRRESLVRPGASARRRHERDLLDVAACCGFTFDPTLVAEAAGVPRIPALKRFGRVEQRHRLVRSAGRSLAFDHHQVAEALYGSILEPLRRDRGWPHGVLIPLRDRLAEAGYSAVFCPLLNVDELAVVEHLRGLDLAGIVLFEVYNDHRNPFGGILLRDPTPHVSGADDPNALPVPPISLAHVSSFPVFRPTQESRRRLVMAAAARKRRRPSPRASSCSNSSS